MAEAIVDFVLQKLEDALKGEIKDALIAEGKFVNSVSGKADTVKRELGRIKGFLKDADAKSKGDERVQNWVREVRGVAYRIEDAIDTFQADVNESHHTEPGIFNFVKKLFNKSMLIPAFHKLGTEMDNIQARIKEISDSRIQYGVHSLQDIQGGGKHYQRSLVILPEIDDMDIVGFEYEKNNIIGKLLDQNTPRRLVVSIVGPGGIGKTTLASSVYQSEEVRSNFDVLIWLSVSQEFKLIDLLRDMSKKIHCADTREHEQSEEILIHELNVLMRDKKYIVVLDDIWTEDVWSQLKPALPDGKNGSRVLITSRFFNIPKAADPRSEPYGLQCLNQEDSLTLLLQKAFPANSSEGYPPDLINLAKQFTKRCDGLPLQLVVLGGLLSTKTPTLNNWEKVMATMDWQNEGKTCLDILALSYEEMPPHLKSCFMSFAVFPEDYKIDVHSLFSYWIVEGFIPKEASGTMIDTAQRYLDELTQRCMIQVLKRNPQSDSIEICRVLEILRNLAIYEAKEKNFITVFTKNDGNQSSKTNARHASFHLYDSKSRSNPFEEKDVVEYTGPNVRTLMFFGMILPIRSKLKLLKVLVVAGTDVTFYYGKHCWLDNVIGLKHLEFRECNLQNNTLPETIDHLYNLELLDLTDTYISDLPKSLKFNEAIQVRANRVGGQS